MTKTSGIDSVDIDFNFEGDFSIGRAYGGNAVLSDMEKDELVSLEGDIRKVGNKYGRVSRNLIIKRLNSSKGEWVMDIECGADLESFYGAALVPATFDLIKARINQSLTYDNLILEKNLTVEVFPISANEIKIVVLVRNDFDENFYILTTHFSASENRFNNFI